MPPFPASLGLSFFCCFPQSHLAMILHWILSSLLTSLNSPLSQQAINLILTPRENDIPELNRCRNKWKKTGDADAALRSLPKGWESSVEAQLLKGLVQLNSNDLVGALGRVRDWWTCVWWMGWDTLGWEDMECVRLRWGWGWCVVLEWDGMCWDETGWNEIDYRIDCVGLRQVEWVAFSKSWMDVWV